ncbi:hypothetical protein [Chryseobacterium sp. FH1]|uniref:hypothetical protein n=1 Tax=Chryseobacterium sp. FH1 TaxID=1233951 RepID=UPI0004E2EF23|nr:hypothetical protein [Chryseobacterium sp. FH1]KFC23002.1 hypothetical protein IO90_05450 [Chryseobacterium sp. FH1]
MQKFIESLFLLSSLVFSQQIFSQVGIGTDKPNATLDVNGDVALRNELSLGGTDTAKGNPGEANQVLVSQGEGLPPTWKYIKAPFVEDGTYKLTNTYLSESEVGISTFSAGVAGDDVNTSSIGDLLDSKWKKIPNLTTQIEVKFAENKLVYQVQTGVEIVGSTAGSTVRFLCGIFKDDKLIALRPDKITTAYSNTPTQYMFTLNYSEQNSPIGIYKMDVACRKVATTNVNNYFSIGSNIPTYQSDTVTIANTGSNSFALKSFFKTDITQLIIFAQ